MAVQKVIQIDVDESGAISGIGNLNKAVETTEQSTKSLRTQLREAQLEVATLSEKFGATSREAVEAAKKAAILKDAIGDAKALTDAFNPDAKFNALSGSIQGVAGGFAAVQGALGSFGVESKNVEEALLRVNSALALSQGLQGLGEARDSFKQLGAVAANALKGIRTGIAATGIGVLLVALGTIVAYWDDIKEAVSGVSAEQEELKEKTAEQFEISKKQLDTLNDQDNTLKLQGKSEKEILQLKIKQYNETIKEAEARLLAIKQTNEAAIKGAERNFNIFKRILQFTMEFSLIAVRAIALPLELMIAGVNRVSQVINGKNAIDFSIEGKITEGKNFIADFVAGKVFDVQEVKSEGEKQYKEFEKEYKSLVNKRDGFILELNKEDEKKKSAKTKTPKKASEMSDEELVNLSEESIRRRLFEDSLKAEDERRKISEQKRFEYDQRMLQLTGQTLTDEINLRSNALNQQLEQERLSAEGRLKIAEAEAEGRRVAIQSIGESFAATSDLIGQETAAGKGLAVAQALINTYLGVTEVLRQKSTLPSPFDVITKVANVATILATGMKAVKNITSVRVPARGGGGSGGNSMPASFQAAGNLPQFNLVGNTGVNQIASAIAGQQPVKAYVVAKEVTTAQELDRNRISATRI